MHNFIPIIPRTEPIIPEYSLMPKNYSGMIDSSLQAVFSIQIVVSTQLFFQMFISIKTLS